MSLSLGLDSRKQMERRMNLRLSTVNQRLMDSWIRKSDIPLQSKEKPEFRKRSFNKSCVHQKNDTKSIDDTSCVTLESFDSNAKLYCRVTESRKLDEDHLGVSNNSDDIMKGLNYLDSQGGSDQLNNSSVNSISEESQGMANHDLSYLLEHHHKQIGSNSVLNQISHTDRCHQFQSSRLNTKRIKSADNTLVESQKVDKDEFSTNSEVEQGLETSTDGSRKREIESPNFTGVSTPLLSVCRNRTLIQPHKLVSLGERNGRAICNKHMPWFGIDIGGSLVKVVFFDPEDATKEETITLKRIRRYLKSSKAYGTTGKRDAHLEMPNCIINKRAGTLHFIRFATNSMTDFLSMAKSKKFADTINNVCATGGGANKFEEDIKNDLGITLHKTDELDSIIHGIHYIDKYNSERECYFLKDPLDDTKCVKVPYDFSRPYPYLVVNIGSGVSILAVYSSTSYSRISGSSIGGGTFLGLCCLLTGCKTFDEAIRLANNGSSTKIDKLVKDIYGGDYPKFNLSGDTVASSFGHMNVAEKRKGVKREDLARALLEMVTINIGSISRMCAVNENIDRVVFIGNFLRVNQLSMKLLSYAVNYWSKGAIKALFLEHEGYFGAVGCFVESTHGCCHN